MNDGSSEQLNKIYPVNGVRLASHAAGIKVQGRADMVLIEIAEGSSVAGVFTRNVFCAAPVTVARQHLASVTPRYFLINAGNANAGTGEQGMRDALESCELVASLMDCKKSQVLPFSTGVIGQVMPMTAIHSGIKVLSQNLRDDAWLDAANAIMTTDTVSKVVSKQLDIDGVLITVTGIAKGSGMICPNMATMLAYIFTDASVEASVLQHCLGQVSDASFNRITVDGDTSTNDACMLVATGVAGITRIDTTESRAYRDFNEAIEAVSTVLAQMIVRDGEGATKFITVSVVEGKDEEECAQVAYTVAHSPLVKTAFFASDPNWGRILAAIGRAGLQTFEIERVSIYLDDICIVNKGEPAVDYQEAHGQRVMDQDEITVKIVLGRGHAQQTVWTCDFSYDYVKVNAEYRT